MESKDRAVIMLERKMTF